MDGNKSTKVFLIFVVYKCIFAQLPNSTTIPPLVNLTGNINGTYMRGELEKEFFLQRLFERYGNNGVLKLEGLNSMFKNIGISSNDITNKDSRDTTGVQNNHIHSHDLKVVKSINRKKNNDPLIYFKRKKRDIPNKQEDIDVKHIQHPECLKTSELLQVYHFNTNRTITQEDFTNLCPGLITVLDRKTCNILTGGVDFDLHYEDGKRHVSDIPSSVWGYSSLSVFIISLVGLLGVAVIPVMQKVFYNHLLQFLVALAVGALSGDAMLHLIPHALAGEHEPHDETDAESIAEKHKERENVIKGLVGLLGIYFFFMIERLMTIITELKRKRQEKEHEKIKRKYADELGDAELKEIEAQLPVIHDHHECHDDCGHMEFGIHPGNKALEQLVEETQRDQMEENVLEEKLQSMHSLDKLGLPDSKSGSEMQNSTGHGHGHSHGHSHGPLPKSVAAIAWMVILGDGIHNFSDGLAIGAAFSNSLTGGISTSIAVFCHELPHEIGDFAVLLKAGMQPKQAIVYNVVSSVLAFMGMLIGVVIGNLSEASTWIFAIVGGMFLYVALVDMLPEMMSVKTKDGENPFCHLMFQICGMMVGIGIMLLIGLFEEDLKTMLE